MTLRSRTKQALAMLLPAGVLGISAVLSTLRMEASTTSRIEHRPSSTVAERLKEIRTEVSRIDLARQESPDPDPNVTLLAAWPNFHFGWGNGGWHNWHNGGWRNGGWGWHNGGWGNGGWGNGGWGNGGWHNWHNFWHNW